MILIHSNMNVNHYSLICLFGDIRKKCKEAREESGGNSAAYKTGKVKGKCTHREIGPESS